MTPNILPLLLAIALPDPPPALVLPFVALLLALACGPLLTPKFWEHHFQKIVLALGALPVAYYFAVLGASGEYLGVAEDYASFMVVIGALFVVSGGIHLRVKGEAKPWINCVYLLIGALLGNVIGTTGASLRELCAERGGEDRQNRRRQRLHCAAR